VTVAALVSLLALVQQRKQRLRDALLLILELQPSSARSIMKPSSSFPDVMPQLWTCCQEIILVCEGEAGISDQLRRALCGSASTPVATLARPMSFFESLDEAFAHAEGVLPFDVLDLRTKRLRWGNYVNVRLG
jgi:hypothetical protein